MHLSTTYYRSPFPRPHRWKDDLARIAEAGFDTIYLFAAWPAAEAVPGQLDFSDLEGIASEAGRNGLKVILNLCSEAQPAWIPRLYPGTEMIDHMGRPVRSSTLSYINFGLMPGGCSDHPLIRGKMEGFLQGIARHFANVPNVLAWDCWNEMRWASQADGYVCFCEHTVARFHAWLQNRFGTLEAFNEATLRKYVTWEDVLPAKLQARNNTDVMLWQQFITDRTAEDLRWRYEQVRAGDPYRPIYAHAAFPTPFCTGEFLDNEYALGRGNDWQLARQVDGYGSSHFPAWFHPTPAEYGARLESARCATGDKPYWIAELQGGAAGHGPQVMQPVAASRQANWVWNGIARGAKGVNFWAWRDEMFGRESGGFGISGDDGHAAERVKSLARTAKILRDHETLLDAYKPAPAAIGVVFEPDVYHMDWSSWTKSDLAPPKERPYPAGHSVLGYLLALERLQLPYDVVESGSATDLAQYKLLVMPWPMIVNGAFAARLEQWVRDGGTLLTEPSLDAFNSLALYAYPAERNLPRRLGIAPSGRRVIEDEGLQFEIGNCSGRLMRGRWREELTPAGESSIGGLLQRALSDGRVIAVDSFIGVRYWEARYPDFERFVRGVATVAGALPKIRCTLEDGERLQWRYGTSGDVPLLFLMNGGDAANFEIHFEEPIGSQYASGTDLATGECFRMRDGALQMSIPREGYRVLRLDAQ